MDEPRIEETGHGSWLLVGDLSFTTVPVLKDKLDMRSAADLPGMRIDLAGVTRSDSAGLALLIEWLRESERLGKNITFLNMPVQMQSIARICGLQGILPAEMAAPPPPAPVPATTAGQPPRQGAPRRRKRKAKR
jgi:phospholipid transport system transporter-binding protein